MRGKTAIVTGASRGIGKAIAIKLAEAGANIVITYKGNDEEAQKPKSICEDKGAKVCIKKADVADEAACKDIVDAAVENFGGVDILVNNAGITRDDVLMRMSTEAFCDVINTNLVGVFNMKNGKSYDEAKIWAHCKHIVGVGVNRQRGAGKLFGG